VFLSVEKPKSILYDLGVRIILRDLFFCSTKFGRNMEEYSHCHESGSQQTSIDEIIQCEKLTKRYPIGNNLAVDQLDLTVHHGEIFGLLVDPNSAGKTTTVGMLTSLVLTSSLGLFLGTRIRLVT
jgi:ABC-type glutathione transport system ATPase component